MPAITDDNRKWWTLGAMCFALFMVMLDNTVVNIALPAIKDSFGASISGLSWTVNAYTLVFGVLLVSGGRLEHPPQRLAHLLELLRGERVEQLPHLVREGRQPVDELAAGVGQADPDDAAVALIALAADMPRALESVDDPGDRRREHVALAAEVAGGEPAAGTVQHVQRERLRHGHALFLDERAGCPLGLGADVVQELSDLRGQSGLPGHRSCSHDSRRILSQKNLSHTKHSDANELAQVDREDR